MTQALHITKKKKEDSTLSERKAAFAAQNQIIKDSLSLVKNKFIVMSGKGGVGKTSLTQRTWKWYPLDRWPEIRIRP